MKRIIFVFILFFLCVISVQARRGCCSHHGGVAGCSTSGRQVCNDGSLSPTCTCTPTYIYGCTNREAINYNSSANKDDGSCILKVYGCMDNAAINYNSNSNISDDSCVYSREIIEVETINYNSIKKYNNNVGSGKEFVVQIGIDGEKEVTYKVITDINGSIVSKEVLNEKIIREKQDEIIEIGTKDGLKTSNVVAIFWIFSIIIVIVYNYNFNDEVSIFNKIRTIKYNKILLYILYILTIIPVFIDVIIIICSIVKKANKMDIL